MSGTSLVTKGILDQNYGDVVNHATELPLIVDYEVMDMCLSVPSEIITETELPDEITTTVCIAPPITEATIELLDVTIEVEEN